MKNAQNILLVPQHLVVHANRINRNYVYLIHYYYYYYYYYYYIIVVVVIIIIIIIIVIIIIYDHFFESFS